jgi:hypothetical protein
MFTWNRLRKKTTPTALFGPVVDDPFPHVDLAGEADPVAAMIAAPEFDRTLRYFAQDVGATRSLLPHTARALLYATIRNLRPDDVVEIGTYQGSTAEVLGRALQANGHGMLHTVSPYDAERFAPVFAQWPNEVRAYARNVDFLGVVTSNELLEPSPEAGQAPCASR